MSITTRDLQEMTSEDLRMLRTRITVILDRRAGEPVEHAVSGKLLRAFSADWPEGYMWPGEPLWVAEPHELDDGEDPSLLLDDERFYDLTGWELERQSSWTSPLSYASLWELFSAWYAKRES